MSCIPMFKTMGIECKDEGIGLHFISGIPVYISQVGTLSSLRIC